MVNWHKPRVYLPVLNKPGLAKQTGLYVCCVSAQRIKATRSSQVVIPRLACFGRIQFSIGDQLRLPGIIDGGSGRGGGGDQISCNRAHDLVIDSNLAPIGCIVLGMVLAMVGDKGPVIQRVAGDLGRLAQKDGTRGNIRGPGKLGLEHRACLDQGPQVIVPKGAFTKSWGTL